MTPEQGRADEGAEPPVNAGRLKREDEDAPVSQDLQLWKHV